MRTKATSHTKTLHAIGQLEDDLHRFSLLLALEHSSQGKDLGAAFSNDLDAARRAVLDDLLLTYGELTGLGDTRMEPSPWT